VTIEELKYNFNSLENKEKIEFLRMAEKDLSVQITNLVLNEHGSFGMMFALVGFASGPNGALEFWTKYWKGTETPEYAHPAWFGLFMAETSFRADEEEKFKKELEAL